MPSGWPPGVHAARARYGVCTNGVSTLTSQEQEQCELNCAGFFVPLSRMSDDHRELLKHLPVDSPTDCYISKLVLEGYITAVVSTPALAEQRDPYAKGDIKHTNIYTWDEKKVVVLDLSRNGLREQRASPTVLPV